MQVVSSVSVCDILKKTDWTGRV